LLSPEQAQELFKKIFDSMFMFGYKEDEKPDAPSTSHGSRQIVKGAVGAPLMGVATGAGALAIGTLLGVKDIGVGIWGGLGNFVGGAAEIGQAAIQSMKKDKTSLPEGVGGSGKGDEGEEEVSQRPSALRGLKRMTIGTVTAPVVGIAKGVGTVAIGIGTAVFATGAGMKGAYLNVKEGAKEIQDAKKKRKEKQGYLKGYWRDKQRNLDRKF